MYCIITTVPVAELLVMIMIIIIIIIIIITCLEA